MSVAFILIFTGSFSGAAENKPSAADLCVDFLEKADRYSLVLKDDGSYNLMIRAAAPINGLFGQQTFAQIMSKLDEGPTIARSLPELSKLEWLRGGGRWEFYAHPKGNFRPMLRYRVIADGTLIVEMNLEQGTGDDHVLRYLIDTLSLRKVPALVSGHRTSVSVERLELKDRATRAALRDFFKFLKENEVIADRKS